MSHILATARYMPHQCSRAISTLASTPNPLPAIFFRGGTSKGIFINRKHLPDDRNLWTPIFLGIMGSPDPVHARQLNGMGGGVSSLSKICVVGEKGSLASVGDGREDVDVEYTFAQVGIRDDVVDYSGNCGNLSSMIGVFAVDEGICRPRLVDDGTTPRRGVVRSFNTNTKKRVDTTFPLKLSRQTYSSATEEYAADLEIPEATVAGVPGLASRIDLDITSPAGSRTGKLFPTNCVLEDLHVPLTPGFIESSDKPDSRITIPATLIDAANPSVFVRHDDLVSIFHNLELLPKSQSAVAKDIVIDYSIPAISQIIEGIRRAGAERMGLDPTAQAQPKIAVVRPPLTNGNTPPATSGAGEHSTTDSDSDVYLTSFSMGVPHRAVPMTLGLCAGVAAGVRGTVVWDVISRVHALDGNGQSDGDGKGQSDEANDGTRTTRTRIVHPSGVVDVGAVFSADETNVMANDARSDVLSARVVRTGRRLMKGVVWW